jgi:hypothetical protein
MRGPDRQPRAVVVKHGLYATTTNGKKLRDQKVRRLLRNLRVIAPWIGESDVPLARRYCELEILASLVYAELRDHGILNRDKEARRLLNDYRMLAASQAILARELMISPAARRALKVHSKHATYDVVGAMASAKNEADTAIEDAEEVRDDATLGEDAERGSTPAGIAAR